MTPDAGSAHAAADRASAGASTPEPAASASDAPASLTRYRERAEALLRVHLTDEWRFAFDRAKRRAGATHFHDQRITVSRYLAPKMRPEEFEQVVLHEIAHALAGARAGHGPEWGTIAQSIGYTGGRVFSGVDAHETAPWIGECPGGHAHYRFRRPSRPVSCVKCHRGWHPDYVINWRRRG